ncbi:MAG: hypothetical protein JAY90_17430 [Candidatus Thiodiazotropha lotti]|nr:hypothetical protein [Candidatus Thiodiazotropha lotti]
MKSKALARTNPFLHGIEATRRRVRSLASSTAIETGESIPKLEQRIYRLRSSRGRVSLA